MYALKTWSTRVESWALWLIATAIGWLAAVFTASIAIQLSTGWLPEIASLILGGVVGGVVLGMTQWFFLQPEVTSIGRWAAASAVGWIAGLVLTVLIISISNTLLDTLVAGVLGGLIFGLVQWFALYPAEDRKANWIVSTIIGWTAALTLGLWLSQDGGLQSTNIVALASTWMIGGVIIGLLTVFALPLIHPRGEAKESNRRANWW